MDQFFSEIQQHLTLVKQRVRECFQGYNQQNFTKKPLENLAICEFPAEYCESIQSAVRDHQSQLEHHLEVAVTGFETDEQLLRKKIQENQELGNKVETFVTMVENLKRGVHSTVQTIEDQLPNPEIP